MCVFFSDDPLATDCSVECSWLVLFSPLLSTSVVLFVLSWPFQKELVCGSVAVERERKGPHKTRNASAFRVCARVHLSLCVAPWTVCSACFCSALLASLSLCGSLSFALSHSLSSIPTLPIPIPILTLVSIPIPISIPISTQTHMLPAPVRRIETGLMTARRGRRGRRLVGHRNGAPKLHCRNCKNNCSTLPRWTREALLRPDGGQRQASEKKS